MPKTQQSFASHAAWFPMFHFVATPITTFYFFYTAAEAVRHPSKASVIAAIWAFGIAVGIFASRLMALSVQDRVIRLEMRLRLKAILPAALAARIPELSTKQLIALRFAGDAEMPALMERVLKGELSDQKSIKAAVRDWQSDYLRA